MFSILWHSRTAKVFHCAALAIALVAATASPARAQASCVTRVGYYDMGLGEGLPSQVPPITASGFEPVQIFSLMPSELANINVLFVVNSNIFAYGAEYLTNLPAIRDAVSAGMTLVVHDRLVGMGTGVSAVTASKILPGGAAITFSNPRVLGDQINVLDVGTPVTNGPGGLINDTTLDNQGLSDHGFANSSTLPAGTTRILSTANTQQVVTFSYPFGNGFVIYGSIPLDFHLLNRSTGALATIYAPNVIAYAGSLRPAANTFSFLNPPVSGDYGASLSPVTSLTAGGTGLAGVPVSLTLFGSSVSTVATDAGGNSIFGSVSLGPRAAGTYSGGAAAFFTSPRFCNTSASADIVINRIAPIVSATVGGPFVYDGFSHAASGSVAGRFGEDFGEPTFSYVDLSTGIGTPAAPVNAGTYRVEATFAGNQNYLESANNSNTLSITPGTSETVLTSSPASSVFGQAVTVNATVSAVAPGGGTPTGQVLITDGPIALGSFPVPGGSLTTAAMNVTGSPHSLTAQFVPDNNNFTVSGSAAVSHTVTQAGTTTALTTTTPDPSPFGTSIVLTATVAPVAPGGGVATGMVQFRDNGDPGPVATLVGGVATVSVVLPAGPHTLTAEYAGTADHGPSTSAGLSHEVTKAQTTTSVQVDAPSVYGQAVTWTATVNRAAPDPGAPAGTVTFMDGTTAIGSSALAANIATFTTDALDAGPHNITAVYDGNANFDTSTASAATQDVAQASATISVSGFSGAYNGQLHGASGSASGIHGQDLSSYLSFGSSFTNAPGGSAHWTFAGHPNYSNESGDVPITITPATATIVVNGFTGVYDGLAHRATGSASGVGGEDLSSSLTLGASFTDAPGGSAAWTFSNTNYAPGAGSVTITINKATLTVKADDKSKTQGEANPPLTASFTGFVNGQTLATSGVTGEPGLSTTATTSSAAGAYPITTDIGTLASTNYAFSPAAGTLTVTASAASDGATHGTGHLELSGKHHHFVFGALSWHGRTYGRFEYWTTGGGSCASAEHDYDRDSARDGNHDADYGRAHSAAQNRFVATGVTQVTFPGRNAAIFSGTGKWNGVAGYTFEVRAADKGKPGRGLDTFSLVIRLGTTVVASVNGTINGGNIQAISLTP